MPSDEHFMDRFATIFLIAACFFFVSMVLLIVVLDSRRKNKKNNISMREKKMNDLVRLQGSIFMLRDHLENHATEFADKGLTATQIHKCRITSVEDHDQLADEYNRQIRELSGNDLVIFKAMRDKSGREMRGGFAHYDSEKRQ